jgi:hypothetical protein
MERSLLIGASALGVVGWLLSLLLARSERTDSAWRTLAAPFRWTAVLLPVLVFLLTLPSSGFFSEGQGFGRGFVIGGAAALLSALAIVGARVSERTAVNASLVATPLWLAIPATAIPLLFMHDVVMDALMGVAIGAFSVSAVVYCGLKGSEEGERLDTGFALLSGAAFASLLAISAGLGIYRGSEAVESAKWGAVAVLSATAVPLGVLLASLPTALLLHPLRKLPGAAAVASKGADVLRTDARRELAAGALRLALGAGLLLVADRLLATRMLDEVKAFYVCAAGLSLGFLCWWLASDGAEALSPSMYRKPLAILIALGAVMASFNLMLGFGMSLMAIALWMPLTLSICSLRDSGAAQGALRREAAATIVQSLWQVATFAVILAAYRFISTRFQDELRGVTLAEHYALFGFMAGAAIPAILAGVAAPGSSLGSPARLLRLIAAGVLALSLPALILILWKAKAALALLAGGALAAAGFDWFSSERKESSAAKIFTPLMALAICLALAQWSPQVLDVATLTRDQKIGILKWVLGGIAALLVVLDLGDRWRQHKARASASNASMGKEAAR